VNKINNFYKFYFVPPILVLLYLKFNKYKNQPKEGGKTDERRYFKNVF